jgi:predicted patatin/cPLA2 family phospholipase
LKILKKREDEIYKLREDGATFRHIASKFNVSESRAHQLYARAKFMKEVYNTLPPLKKLISNRTQIALDQSFKNQNILEHPQKILELGPYKMLKIKKIGRVSLKEIACALYTLGYIKIGDEWSEFYQNELYALEIEEYD